jgi:hypothetical protein
LSGAAVEEVKFLGAGSVEGEDPPIVIRAEDRIPCGDGGGVEMIEQRSDAAFETLDVGVVFRVRIVQAAGRVLGKQPGRRIERIVRKVGRLPEEERLVRGDLGVDEAGRGLDGAGVGDRVDGLNDRMRASRAVSC